MKKAGPPGPRGARTVPAPMPQAALVALGGLVTVCLAALIHSRRRALAPSAPAGGREAPRTPDAAGAGDGDDAAGTASRSRKAVPC